VHLAHRKGMVCAHIFYSFDSPLTILLIPKPRLLTDCMQISNVALGADTRFCRALPAAGQENSCPSCRQADSRVRILTVSMLLVTIDKCGARVPDVLHVLRAEWARTPSDSTPQTCPRWNFNC